MVPCRLVHELQEVMAFLHTGSSFPLLSECHGTVQVVRKLQEVLTDPSAGQHTMDWADVGTKVGRAIGSLHTINNIAEVVFQQLCSDFTIKRDQNL